MFLWGTKIETRIIILQVTSRTWGNLETWSSGMLFDKFSREFENYFQFHLAQKERFKFFNIHVELFCNCAASISLKSSPSRCLCSWLLFSAFILSCYKRNSTTSSRATIRTKSFIRLIAAIAEDCLGTGGTWSVGVVLSSFTGRISVKILHFRIFLVAHNVNYSSMWNVERKKVYKGTGNQGTEKRPEKKSGWRLGNVLSTTQAGSSWKNHCPFLPFLPVI